MSARSCWWCGKVLKTMPNHTKSYFVNVDGNEVAVHLCCQAEAQRANQRITAQPPTESSSERSGSDD